MSANDRQVGGSHYEPGNDEIIQHWDFCTIVQADYLQGYASKYIMRWRKMPKEKGLQDLNKVRHIVEKMLELRSVGWVRRIVVALAGGHAAYRNRCYAARAQVETFVTSNDLSGQEIQVLFGLFLWDKPDDLLRVLNAIDGLIAEASQ